MEHVAQKLYENGILAETPQEKADLQKGGYWKCRNQLCDFFISPDYLSQADDYQSFDFVCPHCGLQFDIEHREGGTPKPGGSTNSGLGLEIFGQIGEDVVEGMGAIPGYGPLLWWHKGGSTTNSHLDGAVAEWGVEVKTVNWASQNLRAIVNTRDRVTKNRAAADPKWFSNTLRDDSLTQVLPKLNLHGVLGVLVLVNMETNLADVYVREMPLSSNIADRKLKGVLNFRHKNATLVAEGVPFKNPLPNPQAPDFVPFTERAPEPEFGAFSVFRHALDYAGDSHPGQEPQQQADYEHGYSDNEWQFEPLRYNVFYANGKLQISPKHGHDELRQHTGINDADQGPTARGVVTVDKGRATWEIDTNIGLKAFDRILRDYTKGMDWIWGGLNDTQGESISDDFEPKRSLYYIYEPQEDFIQLSTDQDALLRHATVSSSNPTTGKLGLQGRRVDARHVSFEILGPLLEWAEESGHTVLAGNDNVLKTIEDLDQWNNYDPDPDPPSAIDEREPSGAFKCPTCGNLFSRWHQYLLHRQEEEPPADAPNEDGHFPEVAENAIQDAHFTPMQPEVFPISYVISAKETEPKDLIEEPVPFIYDIDQDAIFVGHPGARHSDIEGKFTPGGIVEGNYEPGGKVFIRSLTNTPYTVRHMLELWYYQHPEFEVKNVTLRDEEGNETKLAASSDPGAELVTLAHNDPAVWGAYQALKQAGGKVYVVGGAVRDVLKGGDPKDIDLLVQGTPSAAVRKTLEALPGRVDLTGKDFGVFRYRHAGHEVEVALPRKEKSTGNLHTDFDVQVDHNLPVEEDLARRDFTVNAVAVDLDDGDIIDPFGGAQDINDKLLRTVHADSFKEDPLRIVRALVAQSRHGFVPDERTRQEMTENAPNLKHLPNERVQAELDKLFASDDPTVGIQLAHDTNVLGSILPEVEQAWDFDQNNPHHEHPLGEHLLQVLKKTCELTEDPDVRMAALLHDVGKPESAWQNPETGYNHYYRGPDGQGHDHETVGADKAHQRLVDLKYPTARSERVRDLIQHHMYPNFSGEKGARKFLNRVGDHADDLLTLRRADREGKGTPEYQDKLTPVDQQAELIETVRSQGQPTKRSELAITGRDLIDAGMKPGPEMGKILQTLTEQVLEDPTLNERGKLLDLAFAA